MLRLQLLFGALALALVFVSSPASAGCYEIVGCTDTQYLDEDQLWKLGCEQLYDVRNMTYREHGYCFSTAKAMARFGNDGCFITDAAEVPLNTYERANVTRIRSVEKAMGCY